MHKSIRVGSYTILSDQPDEPIHPPVLFVHGYFADASVFIDWLGFFAARGFPAYAINLRGRARSHLDAPLGSASIDDFTDDAATIVSWLGRPFVVGHSMGGLIAQKLAERNLVERAVLLTPAPPRGITVMSARLAVRQLKYLPSILRGRRVTPSHADMRALVLNHVPREDQQLILDRFVPDSGRAGRDMSIAGVPVDESKVKCPMLVVGADDDRFIPSAVAERIAKRYDAELRMVKGRGHMLILEPKWEEIAALTADWLAGPVSLSHGDSR